MKEGIHMKKNHLAIWVTAALLSLPFSSAFAADAADATAPAMEQGMQQGQMPEGQPPEGMMPPGGFNPPGEVTQGTSANTISKNETVKGAVYMSKGDNENALRITGADVSLDRIVAEKISGATSNTEAGDFYGQNAALLATDGAKVSPEEFLCHFECAERERRIQLWQGNEGLRRRYRHHDAQG